MDVGSVDNFIAQQGKKSHITKNTTRCETFANLFRNQEKKFQHWSYHLRVYHFGEEIPALETHFIVLSLLIVISLFERNISTYKINK